MERGLRIANVGTHEAVARALCTPPCTPQSNDVSDLSTRRRLHSKASQVVSTFVARARLASMLIGQMERGERIANAGIREAVARALCTPPCPQSNDVSDISTVATGTAESEVRSAVEPRRT